MLCVREHSWRGRLCVQKARRVSLGCWPCMIDLGKTSVGETDVDWERIERGWRYPRAQDLYKETYIRHLKSRGLSVTKSTKKRNGRLFVTKMRELTDDKNYGTFSKKWGLRVKSPQWIGDQKECTWRRPR